METTNRIKQLLLLILIIAFSTDIYSQITIGSTLPPMEGALLDLKQEGVTTKGLAMPRVYLTDLNNLYPMFESSAGSGTPNTAYSKDKIRIDEEHTGLMVFNINSYNFRKGLYYWNGNKWILIGKGKISTKEMLAAPNTYMVVPGSTLEFPVYKAYTVWSEISKIDPALGDETLTGAIKPELVWQDAKGLILEEPTLVDGDQGISSKIKIKTGKVSGNALIALKVGEKIRWTWHIWVTDYNPEKAGGHNIYSTGKVTNTFMTYNLGAISLNGEPNNILNSMGFLYQWGRPCPFPVAKEYNQSDGSTPHKPLYDINGNELFIAIKGTYDSGNNNLFKAIASPLIFVTTEKGSWYSNGSINPNLWQQSDGSKGLFDPCPEGWRLPKSGLDNLFPWYKADGTYTSTASTGGLTFTNPNLGYYTAAGFRMNADGTLNSSTVAGYYWTSLRGDCMAFGKTANNVIQHRNFSPNNAFTIRCVVE